jgi:predicted enzyme related to lactoylglutathione lyase
VVPLVHVQSVPRAIEFYGRLGFAVSNSHTPEGGAEPVWAWLQAGGAHLMVSRTRNAIETAKQAVLFYLYAPDVEAFRTELLANGVQAGVVEYPFWAPQGEFRVVDPDGYVLMVTHT